MQQYGVDCRGQKGMGAVAWKEKLYKENQMYFTRNELIAVGEKYHLSSDEVMRLSGQLRDSGVLLYLSEERWYLSENYHAQREATALLVKRISRSNQSGFKAFDPITLGNGVVLSRQQMKAINGALQYNISVITGYAGTGKTAVIQGLCMCAPEGKVLLCAPTGKASINLKEKTGSPSYTIDRLKAHPEWDVFKGRSIVIVDEAGMMDILDLQFLLKNIPEEAHLILLGDEGQLPSMGPGNVLRNILEAGIPSFRLTEIFRQQGGWTELMSNLMKCVNRQPYLSANHDGTFEILPHNQNALLKRTVDSYAAGENVQVICPYKKYADILSKLISKCLYSMQAFIAALKDYIARQKPSSPDDESLLEMLFNVYTEFNGFDNNTIREDFNTLYTAMNGKTLREMDQIIYPVSALCRDHEKAGFEEGVKVGIRLAQEINL